MKYVIVMLALALMLCDGVCKAEDGKDGSAPVDAAVTQEEDSDKDLKHVDLGDEPDHMGVMAPGQSYDEETGLPDVVESDDDMELQ